MVVRARVPFDNLDQIGAFGVGQRVLLRPRQETERGVVGRFADTGLGLRAGTRTQRHGSGDSDRAGKEKPRDRTASGASFMLTDHQQTALGPALSRAAEGGPAAYSGG